MGLEKILAKVEVLAGDLANRAYAVDSEKQVMLGHRLNEIRADVQNLEEVYYKARKLLKGKKRALAAGALGDVTKRQKNLADNLNRTMQMIYSGREYLSYSDDNINLRALESNTQGAPLMDDGQTMHDYFVSFHQKENSVSQTRHKDGHGNTMRAIWEASKADRKSLGIKERYVVSIDGLSHGATKWVEAEMEKYLTGAKTILERISQEGPGTLAPSSGRGNVSMQRLRNFRDRHRAGVALAGSSALLAGGLVGGVLLDDVVQARRDASQSKLKADAHEFLGITSEARRFASDLVNDIEDYTDQTLQPYVVTHAILRDRHKSDPEILERLGGDVEHFLETYENSNPTDSLSQEFFWVSMEIKYNIPAEMIK
jgi:hypothetical protein